MLSSICRPVTVLALALLLAACGEDPGPDATQSAAAQAPAVVDGEQIYNRSCFSCHAAGIAGAPKTGNAEAWQPLADRGMDALLASTKAGVDPGMPAMGLCRNCSDAELSAAIEHMLERSGVTAGP